ncbi:kinase-like domain-containing protein [Chytridium lagenaria]|nr:kinase-like domain-containing protein [Chytridium lagenaria]
MVGLGVMLAGIALPLVAQTSSQMILTQGQVALEAAVTSNTETRIPVTSPSIDDLSVGQAFASSRSSLSSLPILESKKEAPGNPYGKICSQDETTPSRSVYCYNELQFALSLTEISDRLRTFPKESRQSTLIAELTLLNHSLPAQICIPIWCDGAHDKPHHIIARIPSNEAVPYLLFIETVSPQDAAMVMQNETDSVTSDSTDGSEVNDEGPSGDFTPKETKPQDVFNEETTNGGDILAPSEASSSEELDSGREGDDYRERMRTAAIMLAQLYNQKRSTQGRPSKNNNMDSSTFDEIRNRLLGEMATLEERRIRDLEANRLTSSRDTPPHLEGAPISPGMIASGTIDKEDPSGAVFREDWNGKAQRIADTSPYGRCESWNLISVIVKSGADLRQEVLALQLIREMSRIWEEEKVPSWVHYFRILVTSEQGGLIETIKNSISLHSIKKQGLGKEPFSLLQYFLKTYGPLESEKFQAAQLAFLHSLAGYSIACYILQIKDRHNGNILLDADGHIVHIDFGFMLSNSPGSMGFELAPFKLPQEFVDLLGGSNSPKFQEYRRICKEAFMSLRKHWEVIVGLVEVMEKDSNLPCFTGASSKPSTVYIPPSTNSFLNMFYSQDAKQDEDFSRKMIKPLISKPAVGADSSLPTEAQVHNLVDRLIDSSLNSLFTNMYDLFQWYSNGIY